MPLDNVMIDIETLGTRHSSVFLSIAAVPFDTQKRVAAKKFFYKTVQLESALMAGLTIDSATLQWWLEQKPAIMAKMFKDSAPLPDVLKQLSEFFTVNDLTTPWGNSASFDLGILANAYQKCGMVPPWKFYNERCYRTMLALFPANRAKKPEDAHDPTVDCYYQIKNLLSLPIKF